MIFMFIIIIIISFYRRCWNRIWSLVYWCACIGHRKSTISWIGQRGQWECGSIWRYNKKVNWNFFFRLTDYLSVLPIVRICNCQWNICQYTKCHTIKCHTQRIVIFLKLWLIVSIFILLNDIQENLQFIKAIEITTVTHEIAAVNWTHFGIQIVIMIFQVDISFLKYFD